MRQALYRAQSRSSSRSRSRSPGWPGRKSTKRSRSGSPFQPRLYSRYEEEMKKKSTYRPYESPSALIQTMFPKDKPSGDTPRKKQAEQSTLTKKQRKLLARKTQKNMPENWMTQETSWLQDVSGYKSERKGGKKNVDSSNIPSVMNMNLDEEHMNMAGAAAWYAKQRMMGLQQQQQMGQFGGNYKFGPTGDGGFAGGSKLYPSLMGMIRGPGFQGGATGGGASSHGGRQATYVGGPKQGRHSGPKASKTTKVPEPPIKLELRPGFITDITLSDPRESSPPSATPEIPAPTITVEKTLDPLKDDDPIGAKYWKGMPHKPVTAKTGKSDSYDFSSKLENRKHYLQCIYMALEKAVFNNLTVCLYSELPPLRWAVIYGHTYLCKNTFVVSEEADCD